jgi:hypothetical protein
VDIRRIAVDLEMESLVRLIDHKTRNPETVREAFTNEDSIFKQIIDLQELLCSMTEDNVSDVCARICAASWLSDETHILELVRQLRFDLTVKNY